MMSEHNKMIARRVLDALWNREDFDTVDALVAADYDGHSSTVFDGQNGAKQFVPEFRLAFPDFQFVIEDQVADADQVATRWLLRGTHKGTFQGIQPTDKQILMTGITIFRIASGRIIDGWTNEDVLGLMQQIGAIPTLAGM
jgi:steroid delta-isomerase-like uncharacterized protein